MRVAYLNGFAGVSGSMLLSALLDVGASLATIQDGWQRLSLPPLEVVQQRVTLDGYTAAQLTFTRLPALPTTLATPTAAQLHQLITQSELSVPVQQRLLNMLTRFADAARRTQGDHTPATPLPTARLSELLYTGSGVAVALDELGIADCQSAPLNLGSGYTDGPDGRVPIPHPLTAELVRDLPVYGDAATGEHTTIDGAAILTAITSRYGPLPHMTIGATGYGASTSAPTPRGLQITLGEVTSEAMSDRIAVLEANIDDMNPEFYEDIAARLFAQGALDVTLTPMFMKKNRPANKLTVLSPLHQTATLSNAMLQETSTFGVRIYEVARRKLDRFWRDVHTPYGTVAVKCGVLDGCIVQAAPEYDACRQLARQHNLPVRLIYAEAARLATPWLTTETSHRLTEGRPGK